MAKNKKVSVTSLAIWTLAATAAVGAVLSWPRTALIVAAVVIAAMIIRAVSGVAFWAAIIGAGATAAATGHTEWGVALGVLGAGVECATDLWARHSPLAR